MIKILLASDLHLGIGVDKTPVPHTFRMVTFRRIASLACSHDILLIAGDFFDGLHVDDDVLEVVSAEFDKILKSGAKIIYVPGEHEIDDDGMPARFLSNLNVTHLFRSTDRPEPFAFHKDGQRIYIYGRPGSDIRAISRNSESGFHIGMFHADFNVQDNAVTGGVGIISKDDLKSLDLDFYALGHQHNFKLIKSFGKIVGVYTGTPESISFEEKGDRYVLSLTVKDDEIYQIKRLTVNSAKMREIEIDCTGLSDCDSVIDQLRGNIAPGTILRAVLKGRRDFVLDKQKIVEFGTEFLRLFIDDRSSPSVEALVADYKYEDTLRGEFFGKLNECIDKGGTGNADMTMLSDILNHIIKTGSHSPEEFLCRYKNA